MEKQRVLYNGKIVTVDKDFRITQAVSIRDGKFVMAGTNEDVKASVATGAEMIDLQGKTVVPGFIDSHNHMLWTALEKPKVSLAGTTSIADVLDIISDVCKSVGPGNWVETSQMGFEPKQLKENRSPNLDELNKVSPNNPVIHEEHFHYSLVNSYVLRLLKINKDTPDPEGGLIVKDPGTGEPTGWLGDNALAPVKAMIPKPTYEEKIQHLKSTIQDFHRLGLTSIIDPWINLDELKIYQDLLSAGEMTMRTKILLTGPPLAGAITTEQIGAGPEGVSSQVGLSDKDKEMLRIDGIKTILDTGVQGTYFRDPYELIPGEQEDPEWRGWLSMSKEEFRKISRNVAKAGWRLGVHCAGDAAIDVLLDVWEGINKEIPIVDKHWVLIHGQIPREEHFSRIRELDLHVACQSVHTYTMGADFTKWWGFDRASYSDPIKTYFENKIRVGGGSDAYFCEWNPSVQIWFDLTRQSKWAGVLGPEQAISRKQSLIYHTINSALISDDEQMLGSIEASKLADLVVLSDDILSCPIDEVKSIKPLMTMMGGRIVYKDGGQVCS